MFQVRDLERNEVRADVSSKRRGEGLSAGEGFGAGTLLGLLTP